MCAETDGAGAEVQEESGGHELRQHSLYRDPKVSNACNESSLLSMHRRKAKGHPADPVGSAELYLHKGACDGFYQFIIVL